jgi:hypothetical protein
MVAVSKLRTSSIDEAQTLVRQCAEPRPAGDNVKAAIGRASRRLNMQFNRTRDIWYGQAKRIDAEEMDKLRAKAACVEIYHAVDAIELLRERLLGSSAPAACEVVAGLDAALRALGRD